MASFPKATFLSEIPITIQLNIDLVIPVFVSEGCDVKATIRREIDSELKLVISELSTTLDKVLC